MYVQSLSANTEFHIEKIGLHLLPYLIFNGIVFYLFLQNPNNTIVSNGILQFTEEVPFLIKNYFQYLLAIVPGSYAVLSLKVLITYQKSLPDVCSYFEKINLNWLRWIVISLIILFIGLFMIINFGRSYTTITHQNLFSLVGGILSIYLLLVGYFGLLQSAAFVDNRPSLRALEENNFSKKAYRNSSLDDNSVKRVFKKLKEHMEQEMPYLDEDLRLSKLARQLNNTENHISQTINQETGSNFFDFVNGYRVEAVKSKLKDPSYAHFSILGIAYDCGFRSKASFNKIFKRQVGKTPSEYRKS